jgi:hypothetical protein
MAFTASILGTPRLFRLTAAPGAVETKAMATDAGAEGSVASVGPGEDKKRGTAGRVLPLFPLGRGHRSRARRQRSSFIHSVSTSTSNFSGDETVALASVSSLNGSKI